MTTNAIVSRPAPVTESASLYETAFYPRTVNDLPQWLTSNLSLDPWATAPVPLPMTDIIHQSPKVADTPRSRKRRSKREVAHPQPSYNTVNGEWDGQTAFAGMPTQERKHGGPSDRSEWVVSHAPYVGNAAYKLLSVLSGFANSEGTCFPSNETLATKSGMSRRAIFRALAELRNCKIAWLTNPGLPVCRSNPYQLSGGLNEWSECQKWHQASAKSGTERVPKVALRTPSSSNPKINPGLRSMSNASKVDDLIPKDEATRVTKAKPFLEEEGVTTGVYSAPAANERTANQYIDNMPDAVTTEQMTRLLTHYWEHWGQEHLAKKNRRGWRNQETALKEYAKAGGSARFKKDLLAKIVEAGLPPFDIFKAPEMTASDQRALAMARTSNEANMAENRQHGRHRIACAGCGLRRMLPKGMLYCYDCAKELAAAAV